MKIIARTSSRVFVGLPLCMSSSPGGACPAEHPTRSQRRLQRHQHRLCHRRHTRSDHAEPLPRCCSSVRRTLLGTAAVMLNFNRSIAAGLVTRVPQTVKRTQAYLEPIIRERYRCMEEYGENWADKPVRSPRKPSRAFPNGCRRTICFNGSWTRLSVRRSRHIISLFAFSPSVLPPFTHRQWCAATAPLYDFRF